MIEKYYEEELRYLIESGKSFAKAHPDRAKYLNIDAVGDRDPYVERLFEGFAFLTGRIREKLDDSFPELTEGLINLLYPQFQQEFPSTAIVEFNQRSGFLQETKILAPGAELVSNPVGSENSICRFTTTQPVAMHPISLVNLTTHTDNRGKANLQLQFKVEPGIKWNKLKLSPLRLYLHGELPITVALHELFTMHTDSIEINVDNGVSAWNPAPPLVTPGGLGTDEAILPQISSTYRGYSLLQEYFIYPEKFMFIDIHGIKKDLGPDVSPNRFTVSFKFDCDFPSNKPFTLENFKLFCSPAINLFKKETEPVLNTGKETEYIVTADLLHRNSFSAHSVIGVVGTDRATGEIKPYEPYNSYNALGKQGIRSYSVHYRIGYGGKRELYLKIGSGQLEHGQIHEENLSINAYCSNGILPREEIREGGISKPGSGFPDYLMFSNITRPSLPCSPPQNEEYLWTFLSHLSATFNSFSTPESLKSFLRLYEWTRSEAKSRKIEAIVDVKIAPSQTLEKGSIIRGVQLKLSIQDTPFKDSGDLHLFGTVLKEFFAQYVSINSFLDLIIETRPEGKLFKWSSLKGKQWPI